MSRHQKNENKLSDSCFELGTFHHIVPGNRGRVLDGRRTPGFIERYDTESAMFIWRITDFEDKGKCWEIPAEEIVVFQFEKDSKKLTEDEIKEIKPRCKLFSERLTILGLESERKKTLELITKEKNMTMDWFSNYSEFMKLGKAQLDIKSKIGSRFLFNDLISYMKVRGVLDLERKTAEQYLLNPYSGEWIKGLKIVMAEMGLIDFSEKRPRTNEIFMGIGSKENRKRYIISRLAFVQTFFELAGYGKVQLFRGVSSEGKMYETPKTLISTSFNPEVGKDFSCIDRNEKINFSFLVKFKYPIENLFMTFLETEAFNKRYKEQEAVILYRNKLTF